MATVTHLARFRSGTAAEFTAEAPVLERGEIAIETDTGVLSIGDGSTAYGASLYRVTLT
jgi:hypothetical protein